MGWKAPKQEDRISCRSLQLLYVSRRSQTVEGPSSSVRPDIAFVSTLCKVRVTRMLPRFARLLFIGYLSNGCFLDHFLEFCRFDLTPSLSPNQNDSNRPQQKDPTNKASNNSSQVLILSSFICTRHKDGRCRSLSDQSHRVGIASCTRSDSCCGSAVAGLAAVMSA